MTSCRLNYSTMIKVQLHKKSNSAKWTTENNGPESVKSTNSEEGLYFYWHDFEAVNFCSFARFLYFHATTLLVFLSSSWILFLWYLKWAALENDFSQILHLWSFLLSWTTEMCFFKVPATVNDLFQVSHLLSLKY